MYYQDAGDELFADMIIVDISDDETDAVSGGSCTFSGGVTTNTRTGDTSITVGISCTPGSRM